MGPHHPALDEQPRQHRWIERAQPRPEPGERFLRLLGLETAQVPDGVDDRQVRPLEQELPGERRAA
jgi:hypothetical protein